MENLDPDKIRSAIDSLLKDDGPLRAIYDSAQTVEQLVKLTRNLMQAVESTQRDLADLRLMHESTLDHATNVENELEEKNARITELTQKLRKYLPDALYDQVMGGRLEAESPHQRKRLTILFSDIVGFTTLTDHLEPEMLSELLNSYLDAMAELVNKWGGVIDKFIGDAVMVFFGDRDGANIQLETEKCVLMALEMQQQMSLLRQRWSESGLPGDLRMRIGINTGYCTLGNFGSEKRMDYTIIGGQVNAASRLEHLAPPGGILISGSTYLLVKDKLECLPRGVVALKGIHHELDTYEVIRQHDVNSPCTYLDETEHGFQLRALHFDKTTASRIEREELRVACQRALQIIESLDADSPDCFAADEAPDPAPQLEPASEEVSGQDSQ